MKFVLFLIVISAHFLLPQSKWLLFDDTQIVYSGDELLSTQIDRDFEFGSNIFPNYGFESSVDYLAISIAGDGTTTITSNGTTPITGTKDALIQTTVTGTNALRPAVGFYLSESLTAATYYLISFSYKINSGTVLHGGYYNGVTVVGGSTLSGTDVYRYRLYDVSNTFTVLTNYWNGTNLFNIQLDNLSILKDANYTSTGNHSYDSTTAYKQAGSYAGKIVASAAGNGTTNTISLASTKFTAVTDGLNYRFQVYAYTSTANTTLTFKLGDIVLTSIVPTTGMSVLNFDFKATASSTGNILLYLDKAATVYLDDISLKSGQ